MHVRGGDRRSHAFHSFCRLAPLIRYLTHRMGSLRVTIAVETQFDKQRVMMAHVPAIMELSPELKVRVFVLNCKIIPQRSKITVNQLNVPKIEHTSW